MQSGARRFGQLVTAWLFVLIGFGCSAASGGRDEPSIDEGQHAEAHHEFVFGSADLNQSFDHVDGYAQSAVLAAPDGATRAGFLLDTQEGVSVAPPSAEVRGVRDDGTTTEWVPIEVTFHEGPHAVLRARRGARVRGSRGRLPCCLACIPLCPSTMFKSW